MRDPIESARELLVEARDLYALVPEARDELALLEARLDEPLRVALVGSVKSGKSTLLNGLLGERIAPTDSRECTRIVTWYHYSRAPRVQGRLVGGETVSIPTRRQPDRLELDLAGLSPTEVERLDVSWPAPGIQGITLIDTPGIASASHDISSQTDRFLLPEHGAAGADAVVYLLRSLHESDIEYMKALHERTRHGSAAMGAIAVLSRADELGSGRLTAMFSINEAVHRLREDPALTGVCETIVPVAGLMGMGAMTLRQTDFATLRQLATLDDEQARQLLVSAELFITAAEEGLPSGSVRADLVERFGMYGIRIAIAAVRGGVADAEDLAAELLRRSGLEELRRTIDVHFAQRQPDLKAYSTVLALHQLLRATPVQGSDCLLVAAEEHMASAHAFTEMQLVGRIASGRLHLAEDAIHELERLVGGRGASHHRRLGLDAAEEPDTVLAAAVEHLRRWRSFRENPLLDRATSQACRIAERSCERIISELMEQQLRSGSIEEPLPAAATARLEA
ncbi:dynamin-like GTPase family protein [Agrococcus versicolor]|uniref:Dynamin-like GTPase family protein n=1 Tax=Agrococcus versicolor TaxID=501482 RepID=A0ABN3AMG4_9MICO